MAEKRTSLSLALALAGLVLISPAQAVPCGSFATVGGVKLEIADGPTLDLGASSATCQNGPTRPAAGFSNDSAAAMNAGAGFFGITEWTLLNKVPDQPTNGLLWSLDPAIVDGETKSGQFTLAAGVWDIYDALAVVLKDGGSTSNSNIFWSAYLLPENLLGAFDWSYDGRKGVSHLSLYGVLRTVTVPEPGVLALFLFGLAGIGLALRYRPAAAA